MAVSDRSELVHGRPHHPKKKLRGAHVLAMFAIVLPMMLASTALAQAVIVVSGTTYLDVNDNGVRDAGELGLGNVRVLAYNDAGAVIGNTTSSTTMATLGQYTLTVPAGSYRVEFDLGLLPTAANYQPAAQGSNNGSSIVIASATSTIDYGVNQPTRFCQNNPDMAATCHAPLDQSAGDPVIYRFPYTAGTPPPPPPPAPAQVAFSDDIGTTWGVAYQPTSGNMFASSFLKRHAAFHTANATGAIYRIPNARSATPGPGTLFLDLNALLGPGTTGNDTRPAVVNWPLDATPFLQIGKVSLGDLDLAEDGVGLWTVNLASRELYYIPIGVTGTAPTSAAAILRYPIPLTTAATANASLCPSVSDARPFAVEPFGGKVYVGLVCSAESTQQVTDLRALVFSFDIATQLFAAAPVLNTPLNYGRLCADQLSANPADCNPQLAADWRPWTNTVLDFAAIQDAAFVAYPQPWLTDIVFDRGNIILAFRDRFGDQAGYQALNPDQTPPDGNNYIGVAAGDILRACPNGAGVWVLESNAQCGGVTAAAAGIGNYQGPGGGEFCSGDNHTNHNDITVGGLAQLPSSNLITATAYDPMPTTFEGGALWLNNDNGTRFGGYVVYGSRFAKSNGMADLLALCDAAPVEIGNRVWFDADGDGVQDPGERPLGGVTVQLVDSAGNVIGTAVTDANGHYYFSNDTRRSSTTSEQYGITGLQFGQTYSVRIPLQQTALDGTFVTQQDHDASAGGNSRDADGDNAFAVAGSTAAAGTFTTASFTVGGPGQNNHSYDFGFTISPTAIALQRLAASREGTVTQISWATTSEQGTFGFQIYRSDDATWESAVLLTPQAIHARGGSVGASYDWADTGPPPTAQTRYWLIEIETGGGTNRYGPVAVGARVAASSYQAYLPDVSGP
jgi:hypothetical protein